ncbi:helix-turn-helix DNA binding protein [Mycobacterium phage Mask]|nr:helix-turn-helix DNA binding protein [Mycobacterium phage Sejanus]UVT31605.1 helix-turn-helix DNA binding protein [Mycobacterium phage Mask]
MTSALVQVMADLQAAKERETEAARKQLTLFALEAINGDGCPRVSAYTVDHLVRSGLAERIPGDTAGRLRLTAEGRIMLHANPAESEPGDELVLFGGL